MAAVMSRPHILIPEPATTVTAPTPTAETHLDEPPSTPSSVYSSTERRPSLLLSPVTTPRNSSGRRVSILDFLNLSPECPRIKMQTLDIGHQRWYNPKRHSTQGIIQRPDSWMNMKAEAAEDRRKSALDGVQPEADEAVHVPDSDVPMHLQVPPLPAFTGDNLTKSISVPPRISSRKHVPKALNTMPIFPRASNRERDAVQNEPPPPVKPVMPATLFGSFTLPPMDDDEDSAVEGISDALQKLNASSIKQSEHASDQPDGATPVNVVDSQQS